MNLGSIHSKAMICALMPASIKSGNLAIAAFSLLLASCQPGDKNAGTAINGEKPLLFVSLPPQAFLMKSIAGPSFDVRILIEPGQDPHHWQPEPKQVLALGKAAAWLPSNLPFEYNIIPKLGHSKNNAGPRIIAAIESTDEPESKSSPNHAHPDGHHHDTDPHTWLSPPLLIRQANSITGLLSEMDPDNASAYQERAEMLNSEIENLHQKLIVQLAPYQGYSFLSFHSALSQFAQTYKLNQLVIQSGDSSPDPRHLRDIVQQARDEKVRLVLIQPQFDDHSARMVAEAIGGKLTIIDPLREDVLANLQQIADTLTGGFSQDRPSETQ